MRDERSHESRCREILDLRLNEVFSCICSIFYRILSIRFNHALISNRMTVTPQLYRLTRKMVHPGDPTTQLMKHIRIQQITAPGSAFFWDAGTHCERLPQRRLTQNLFRCPSRADHWMMGQMEHASDIGFRTLTGSGS